MTSPAVTGDRVYFVTESGTLYALDRERMEPVWNCDLGAGGAYLSSPTVARGHVYVGTEGRGMLCLGEPAGAGEKIPIWPGAAGSADGSPLPDRGALLWGYPPRGAEPLQIDGPVAALGDTLYVPVCGGARTGLLCLTNSAEARQAPEERRFFPTPNAVRLSPAAGERLVLCVDGAPGDAGRHLHGIDPEKGAELWSFPVDADASGEFALDEGGICLQSASGELTRLDPAGRLVWQVDAGPLAGVPARLGPMLIAARRTPSALLALDAPTGRTLYEAPLDGAPTVGPAVAGRTAYLGTQDGLEARDPVDGALKWRAGTAAVASALAVGRDRIAYVGADSALTLVRLSDGAVVAQLPGALPALRPLLTREAVLFAADGSLERYSIADGRRERWMDISWLGALVAPPVMAQSRVYFSTGDRGLVRAGRWQ